MVASATPTVIKKRKKKKSNRRKPARPVDHSGRISTISCACVLPPPRVFRLIISFLGEKKKKKEKGNEKKKRRKERFRLLDLRKTITTIVGGERCDLVGKSGKPPTTTGRIERTSRGRLARLELTCGYIETRANAF